MTDDQLTRDDLAGMTPEQIERARRSGRLDRVLGYTDEQMNTRAKAKSDAVLTRADVERLAASGHHSAIKSALSEGRLADVLNNRNTDTEEN